MQAAPLSSACSRHVTSTPQQGRKEHLTRRASLQVCQARGRAPTVTIQARQSQSGSQATKRKLSGPPNLPPINDGSGGGGGGGDGWNWGRTARNVAPNLAFLGLYFAVTSWGGDGFNFGAAMVAAVGGGGGGGGGDGAGGSSGAQNSGSNPGHDDNDDDERVSSRPTYTYSSSSSGRSSYRR